MRPCALLIVPVLLAAPCAPAQVPRTAAGSESFDQVVPPALPTGWTSSRRRIPGSDDFASSASSPRSQPNALLAQNATLEQWLLSPVWRLEGGVPDRLQFWTRRSATFLARLVVEASLDSGRTFDLRLGDTLRATGASVYVFHDVPLPATLAAGSSARFRWRVLPDSAGSAGTFRIDDVALTGSAPAPALPAGCLVLNEIMYAPAPGEPEWIEILNAWSDTLRLQGLQLNDAAAGGKPVQTSPPLLLPPGALAVLTRDTAALEQARGVLPSRVLQVPGFPGLNNDRDVVVLGDQSGRGLDSVAYSDSWHNPAVAERTGRSLERVRPEIASSDPRNWTSSASRTGATPGLPNSVFARILPASSSLSCAPNPFSPDADGRDDLLLIRYTLPAHAAVLSVSLFDLRGRKIRSLAGYEPSGPGGLIVWDGRDDAGERAPVGIYIILLEAARLDGAQVFEARTVAVLALPL